jgi:hypothetical protein
MSVTGIMNTAEQALFAMGPALPAVAAEERTPPSDLGVWIFLGFCALIVAAQVIPAIRAGLRKKASSAMAEHTAEGKLGH